MDLPRTPVPNVFTIQPLLAGIEPPLAILFGVMAAVLVFSAQSAPWLLIPAFAVVSPLYIVIKRRTEKDPFFFRIFQQSVSTPKFFHAVSSTLSPPDKVQSLETK